jgi:hypothetical protein
MIDKIAWWQELSAEFGLVTLRPDEIEWFFQQHPDMTKDELRLLFEQIYTPTGRAIGEAVRKHIQGCTEIGDP